MKKLPYIEDYIGLLADDPFLWPPRTPLVKLARYDEPIVNSMNQQINRKLGLTDKQAVLAHKIVVKYKKQWAQSGYDISHLETTANYRLPIRTIDREKLIDVVDGHIQIKFPYDQEIISNIRATNKEIPGKTFFDHDKKYWSSALIEQRIIWAKEFGSKHEFKFGSNFLAILDQILGQDDFSIKLMIQDNQVVLNNATDTLLEYLGPLEISKIINLMDHASICDYQVDDTVYKYTGIQPQSIMDSLLTQRHVNINYPDTIDLTPVIEYAKLVNRWPIYVYETGSAQLRNQIYSHFEDYEIVDRRSSPTEKTGRVLYFSHWKFSEQRIPLLVTSHTYMIGTRRQQMLQSSDKIVYYTHLVEDNA